MLMIFVTGSKIRPKQIRLEELFSVERILSSRGFSVKKEGNGEDTILPKSTWSLTEANLVFEIFNDKNLRKELLNYIEDKVEIQSLSGSVLKLINIADFKKERQRFSTTFEWYVGQLMVRKFGAFSSSYGVLVEDVYRNSDNGTSGDFDVLSIMGNMALVYVECKSGNLTQKSIKNTLERGISLHCSASIIIQERLNENSLIQQVKSVEHPIFGNQYAIDKIGIKEKSDSLVYKWFNCYFIDSSLHTSDFESKIRTVLRVVEAKKNYDSIVTEPGDSVYEAIGYSFTTL
jgi:hypothetical protein